jgi:hypothetical protein
VEKKWAEECEGKEKPNETSSLFFYLVLIADGLGLQGL